MSFFCSDRSVSELSRVFLDKLRRAFLRRGLGRRWYLIPRKALDASFLSFCWNPAFAPACGFLVFFRIFMYFRGFRFFL